MKFIRTFESFKSSKKDSVNEELLGGILSFFKNMWNKAMEELKKLGDDPDTEDVKSWIADNPFNTGDNNYLFKNVMDEFKKKPEANDQDALTLVDNILNPETGVLGKQGLAPLYENLKKAYPPEKGEPMSSQVATFEYIFNTIRTKAIVQYKFAGGPTDGKVDPKKINVDLKDTVHLPEVKKLLTAAADGKKKKEVIVNWCEKTLFPQLDKMVDAITEDEINKYLESKKIPVPEGGGEEVEFKVGDTVVYKREKFKQEEWDKLTDDEKKKPEEGKMKDLQKEQIGIKKISKIDGDKISFEDADFTKEKGDILMKAEAPKAEGQEDLVKTLADVKAKNPDAIKKLGDIAKIYQEPDKNKDKIAEIEKQLGGGEEGK